MGRFPTRSACLVLLCLPVGATPQTQKFDPPAPKSPDRTTLAAIAERTRSLRDRVQELHRRRDDGSSLPSVEVYLKAAEWIVRHAEWFVKDSGKQTLAVLDQGIRRADEAAAGKQPWLEPTDRSVSRGYRSRVDGSVQPYAVSYPADYGTVKGKTYRLDVVLHGRDSTLTEVKFLHQHAGIKPVPKEQDYIQIDVYGRGNNAYRWAGETDVWEVIDHFRAVESKAGRAGFLDSRRVVLRGFSMGGAGTWHLGLHHPDRFAVIGPGAGFTTTHGYIKGLPNPLPPHQEACLTIYDAVNYAENARMLPIVAYSGEKDPQKAAADNIERRLRELKIDAMTHLVAPGLEHRFPPEWQKKAEVEWSKFAGPGKGRPVYPGEIHFVTHTLKYPSCDWVEVTGLERHYDKASITARRAEKSFRVDTKNVRSFRLRLPPGQIANLLTDTPVIDGQTVPNRLHYQKVDHAGYYVKDGGKWSAAYPPEADPAPKRRPEKRRGLQGPIDDAFTDGFVCVRGSGAGWSPAMHRAAEARLDRFGRVWDKYLRGTLPVIKDNELTDADIASKHLILFGDPSSNSVIAKVLDKLPLQWSAEEITLGDGRYDARTHLPVMIYPNPLNPKKYVVINSGHTFHEAEFRGTNAQLYPRLGDFSILKPAPTAKDPAACEVIRAGLFNESWKVPESK